MSRATTASPDQRSSTTASTASPAAALTTPFAPPPSCGDIWLTTTGIVAGYLGTNTSKTVPFPVTIVASNPADPRFAACQPPGWDAGAGPTGTSNTPNHNEGLFTFSPAVCPSGWTAWYLGHTYIPSVIGGIGGIFTTTSYRTISTAYCCAPSFEFGWPERVAIDALRQQGTYTTWPGCHQTVVHTESYRANGVKVHRSWHIRWEASDTTSMSPAPPVLPCYDPTLTSWVPGGDATVPEQTCRPWPVGGDDGWNQSVAWFLILGVPLLFVVLVATGCFFCCRHRRRQKEKKIKENMVQTKDGRMERNQDEKLEPRVQDKILEPPHVQPAPSEQEKVKEEAQRTQPGQTGQEKGQELQSAHDS